MIIHGPIETLSCSSVGSMRRHAGLKIDETVFPRFDTQTALPTLRRPALGCPLERSLASCFADESRMRLKMAYGRMTPSKILRFA